MSIFIGAVFFGFSIFVSNASPLVPQDDKVTDQIHQKNRYLPHYNRNGESLRQKLATSGDTGITTVSMTPARGTDDEDLLTPEQSFESYSCKADAIVIGLPISSVSLLSANETEVFSDYEIQPIEILKNSAVMPLTSDKTFTLTRPGGTIKIDIGTIRQIYREYPALSLRNRYLMFISNVTQSKSYKSVDAFGSFLLRHEVPQVIGPRWELEKVAKFISSRSVASLRIDIEHALGTCSSVP